MKKSIFAIFFVCLITGIAIAEERSRPEALVGFWYGERSVEHKPISNKIQKELIERHKNGDIFIKFKIYDKTYGNLLAQQTEFGQWWLDNDIYTTKITKIVRDGQALKINTPEGYYLENYKITEITNDQITYRNVKDTIAFIIIRVPPDFTF